MIKADTISINKMLGDMLCLPKDTYRATLVMEANELPRLTIERVIFRSGQVTPLNPESFRLVPDRSLYPCEYADQCNEDGRCANRCERTKVGDGETAHNAELRGRPLADGPA
jgi:hypothetical protein